MNTNDVCKGLNVTLKSLRVYEECGIVIPKREGNNYRNYSEDDLWEVIDHLKSYLKVSIVYFYVINVICRIKG